jgi:hypothetical protein
MIEKSSNLVKGPAPYKVSEEALQLFHSLNFVANLHSNALLWSRNLTKKPDFGHVGFPRMQEANVAIQVFTIVSKSPRGQNMDFNRSDAQDNITLLNIVQGRPISNWFTLINRNMCQSNNLRDFTDAFGEEEIRAIMGENVRHFLLKNL